MFNIGAKLESTRFITVSNCITREAIKGHPYWFHKTLELAASKIGITLINCGPIDQECETIKGSLSHSGRLRSASSVFGLWDLSRDGVAVQKVLKEENGKNLVHFYEGGFREFILARMLLRSTPDVVVLFNFNYTDPWHLLADKKTLGAFLARIIVGNELRRFRARLVPLAETHETSIRFAGAFKSTFFQYPLFSTIPFSDTVRSNKERSFDAVFFPADTNELSLVVEAIERISRARQDFNPLIVSRWGLQLTSDEILKLQHKGIRYVGEVLDSDSYKSIYADCKLAVFPYESTYSRHTSSGRLLDAAMSGCFCIAPVESLPGRQISREGWGSAYKEMTDEVKLGLSSWEDFKPRNVPSAENSLRELLKLAKNASTKSSPTTSIIFYLPDFVVFTLVLIGTGIRSWGPRIIQAYMAMRSAKL